MVQLHGDILQNGDSKVAWLATLTIETTSLTRTLETAEYCRDVLSMGAMLPRDQVRMPHIDGIQLELSRRM